MGKYINSYKGIITVQCPKCEKFYKKEVFYTGSTPPKYYCELCLKAIDNIEHAEPVGRTTRSKKSSLS